MHISGDLAGPGRGWGGARAGRGVALGPAAGWRADREGGGVRTAWPGAV
jgi:hypothetical protein